MKSRSNKAPWEHIKPAEPSPILEPALEDSINQLEEPTLAKQVHCSYSDVREDVVPDMDSDKVGLNSMILFTGY